MKSNWVKIGQVDTNSGLLWLSDPHAIIHSNNAMEPELGLNYNQFVDFMGYKEQAQGTRGHAQFSSVTGGNLGVCVQGNIDLKTLNVWAHKDSEGNVLEVRILLDNSEPV